MRNKRDEGFTLIELMVVVLVIAILLAIAIPTFLGARQRAQNSVAKTSLRTGLQAAATLYTDSQSYASASGSTFTTAEGSLSASTASTVSTGAKNLSINAAAGQWDAAVLSDSGRCYAVRITSAGAVSYANWTPTALTVSAVAGTCTGAYAAVLTASASAAAVDGTASVAPVFGTSWSA